jgi:hypothetical protein
MNDNDISEQFRITGIIYSALIFGLLFVFAISLFLVEGNKLEPNQSIDEIFRLFIPLSGIVVMYLSRSIYNKNISSVNKNEDLLPQIAKYRTFKIIQWAIIESGAFLSIVGFIITGNYLYAIVFLFLLGFFILNRPSKEQFISDFKISENHKNIFTKSN